MASPQTEIGGDARAFPSTSMTVLGRVEDLIAQYWKPVYVVLRSSWAKSNEEAKDLTQEFFIRAVLEGGIAAQFDPARGSFRSLLKGALQNFMMNAARDSSALKRGGGARPLRLDAGDVELSKLVADAKGAAPDRLFDEAWKQEVLGRSLRRLEERLAAAGKSDAYRAFCRYELDAGRPSPSYEEVAQELGLTPNLVKHALGAAREEFRRAVADVLRGYSGSPEVLAQELRELFAS